MRPTLLLVLLLLGAQAQGQAPDSIATILSLGAQRRAANLPNDAHQLAAILAEDFVDVGGNGVHRTKLQNVDEIRRGVIRWTTLVARNEHVTVFDSTAAVITGEQEGSGSYDGRPFARHARYLRVSLKRRGQWQNVAAQNSLITS